MSPIPIHKVSVREAVSWVGGGWTIFRASIGLWLLIGLIDVLISSAVQFVPYLGLLIIFFLTPVFAAGFQFAAREASEGRGLRIEYLFQGFREPGRLKPLLMLGGVYVGSFLATALLAWLLIVGFSGAESFVGQLGLSMARNIRILLALLIALAIFLPVLMALYYAPPLIMFRGAPAGQALWSSLVACIRNFWPLSVFGLVVFLILFLLFLLIGLIIALPIVFGVATGEGVSITAGIIVAVMIALLLMIVIWIPLMPILMCMNYCSYRSIYK